MGTEIVCIENLLSVMGTGTLLWLKNTKSPLLLAIWLTGATRFLWARFTANHRNRCPPSTQSPGEYPAVKLDQPITPGYTHVSIKGNQTR